VASLVRAIACWLCAVTAVLRPAVTASAEDQPAKPAGDQAFIAVRVVDENGDPRAGVHVYLFLSGVGAGDLERSEKRPFVSAECDAEGWAVFGPVRPGGGYSILLVCQPEGYYGESSYYAKQTLTTGRNEYKQVYRSRTGPKVKGVLLDRDGKPLVGLTVRMAPRGWGSDTIPTCEPMRRQPSCTSDEKGAFLFDSLPDSTYVVVVVRDFNVLFRSKSFRVGKDGTVDLNELVTDLDSKGMKPAKEPGKKEDTKEQGK